MRPVVVLVILLSICGVSSAQFANSPWPMFQHDLNHTGRSPYNTSSLGGLKWSVDLGDIVSSPVIGSDGTIYVVGSHCYDRRNNYWESKLYAIFPNGSIKWSTNYMWGQSNVKAPAIASDGTIYVPPAYGTFYAYYPNGTQKWSVGGIYSTASSPAIGSDGTVYVGDNIGRVFAIYPNGTVKWSYDTGYYGVGSSPVIADNGIVYIGGSKDSKKLYAFNSDGTINCTFTASDGVSTPAIGENGTIYVGSLDHNLYAIYPNCTLKWSFDTGDKIYSSPAIGKDGTIYVGSYNGKFYAIYPNGTLKWNYTLGGNITWASPVIDGEGNIYIGSKDGKFYAFYPNGTLKWTVITGASIVSSPAIGKDGTIYLPGNDGVLYAITNKTQVMLSNSSWPMFMHDLKHTGRSPYKGYEEVGVKWMIDLGNGIIRPPVLGKDGTIYVGVYYSSSNTGRLFAIFPNGTVKWNYTISGATYGIDASPVVMSDGSVCIHSGAGGITFHCLYPNGTLRWEKRVTVFASYDSSPVVYKDTIFFGTNGEFYAYTIDGSEKWHYPGYQISVSSSPAIDVDRETVYFQDNRGYLRAISLTGKEIWVKQIGSSTYSPSSPAIDDNGTIYIGHKDGIFYAFYPNGTQKWNITLGVPIYSSPAIGNDSTVYFSTNSTLYAINPNGTVKWSFNTGSTISSASPVIDNSGDIYQCAGSNLLAFNSNGTLKWNFTASGSLTHMTPAIGDDGTIYIGTNDGKLYALSDVIPPRVNIISPQDTTYNTSTIQINVSATDLSGINTVIAQIDGTTNITLTLSNGYYVGTVNLADGNHSVRIYANDTLGNMNSSVVVYFSVNTSQPSVIYVPDDYAKIKWAVENATAGSIIYVGSGTYSEYNINVTKRLNIIGLDYPVLTSPQDRGTFYGFNVSANNVTIAGFNFGGFAGYVHWGNRYGTGIPIRVNGNDIRIENCTFGIYNGETNDYGILIENSKNVEIDSCSIFTSNLMSVEIRDSENVTMSNSMLMNSNNPWNNVNGIYILRSSNVTIYNNTLSIYTVGVKDGIVVDSSDNCSIVGNKVSGSGIDKAIMIGFSNGGGSLNCTIKDNIIKGTKFGIYVGTFSKHNLIENNTIRNVTAGYMGWCCYLGAYGIEIAGDNNVVLNNTIENSTYLGMVVEGCGNVFRNNTMKDNLINFRYEADCSEPNDIDSSNTVDSKIIGYYYNASNITLSSSNIGTVILEGCSNVNLKDLTLSRNFYGALILKSENVTLENVTAVNNMKGIALGFSKDVRVDNCTALSNYVEGMWMAQRGVANATVKNCNVSGNGNGIVVIGHHAYTDAWIVNVSIVNNRIYNNTLDLLADWGNYGIVVDLANNVTVKKNEIFENKGGIKLQSYASALIEDNRIYNNSESGIFVSDNSYGDIFRNTVINNTYGVNIDKSNAYLKGNDVKSNEYGLHVYYSKTEGKFNYFHNNTIGIFSQLSTTNMSYSSIVNNTNGIIFEEHWMHEGSGNFTFNNIVNYQFNFVNNETYNISAINNWWGTTNETIIEQKILDYYDNNETGVVFYKPYMTEPLVFGIKGDFNHNGYVDIGDVVFVAHMIVGKVKPDLAADFNNNGRVDIGDLAKIAYYLLGKISEL